MNHNLLTPSFTRSDQRGTLTEVLNDGHWESLLTGSMTPGAVMGNHYHNETLVFFFLVQGVAAVRTVNVATQARDSFMLTSGQGVILHTGESHVIEFVQPSDFIMLKSLRYDPANPDTFHYPVD